MTFVNKDFTPFFSPESSANKKAKKDAERSKQDITTVTSQGKKAADFTNEYKTSR